MSDINRGLAAIIALLWSAFWSGVIFLSWWPDYTASIDLQDRHFLAVFDVATDGDARLIVTTIAGACILVGLVVFWSEAWAAFRPKIVLEGEELVENLRSDVRTAVLEVRELAELIRYQVFAGRVPPGYPEAARRPSAAVPMPVEPEPSAAAESGGQVATGRRRRGLLRRAWGRLRGA